MPVGLHCGRQGGGEGGQDRPVSLRAQCEDRRRQARWLTVVSKARETECVQKPRRSTGGQAAEGHGAWVHVLVKEVGVDGLPSMTPATACAEDKP